jgi:ABC-type histidine transport system ATPase subunit
MRQRAALARTLAVDPLVLLMDEPFSALDAQTKMILQQDLAQTVQKEGKTVVFITHDLAEAVALVGPHLGHERASRHDDRGNRGGHARPRTTRCSGASILCWRDYVSR